jgi:hypothetical protein|tara:strand:- start:446 stop:622 length:177 start_codon:yes stop_codon:yes gene_type:complete
MAQKNLKLDIIEKVLMLSTNKELQDIRENVRDAISRECDLDNQEQEEFKKWKENQVNA